MGAGEIRLERLLVDGRLPRGLVVVLSNSSLRLHTSPVGPVITINLKGG